MYLHQFGKQRLRSLWSSCSRNCEAQPCVGSRSNFFYLCTCYFGRGRRCKEWIKERGIRTLFALILRSTHKPNNMKYLFFTLVSVVFLAHCSQPTPIESTASFVASPDQDTASYVPLYIHQIPPLEEINNDSTAFGQFEQRLPPPMDRTEAQVLTNSYWVMEGYADHEGSRQQRIAATGQWLRCLPDGSFQGGHWDRQTHSGLWYLHYNYKYPRLLLDSNVDRLDATWEIQGLSGDRSEMAWVRLSGEVFGLPHRSISVRLIELYDRPTKEQFAGVHRGL